MMSNHKVKIRAYKRFLALLKIIFLKEKCCKKFSTKIFYFTQVNKGCWRFFKMIFYFFPVKNKLAPPVLYFIGETMQAVGGNFIL